MDGRSVKRRRIYAAGFLVAWLALIVVVGVTAREILANQDSDPLSACQRPSRSTGYSTTQPVFRPKPQQSPDDPAHRTRNGKQGMGDPCESLALKILAEEQQLIETSLASVCGAWRGTYAFLSAWTRSNDAGLTTVEAEALRTAFKRSYNRWCSDYPVASP